MTGVLSGVRRFWFAEDRLFAGLFCERGTVSYLLLAFSVWEDYIFLLY
jgi:hypothetical protein